MRAELKHLADVGGKSAALLLATSFLDVLSLSLSLSLSLPLATHFGCLLDMTSRLWELVTDGPNK